MGGFIGSLTGGNFILWSLILLAFALLLFIPGFRRLLGYLLRNSLFCAAYALLSAALSPFGHTLALNALTLAAPLLLGLPGICLAVALPALLR